MNGIDEMLVAAVEGIGIGFVLEDQAAPYLESGELVVVLDDWCQPFPGFHLYYASRKQASPTFSLVVDALRYRQPPCADDTLPDLSGSFIGPCGTAP